MKNYVKFLLILIVGVFAMTSNQVVAQQNIYVNAGETVRVKTWSKGDGSQNLSLDTNCDLNLSGNEFGDNADTIVATGSFSVELGNADAQYLYYDWLGGTYTTHTVVVPTNMTGNWLGGKLSSVTGYEYIADFWVRFITVPSAPSNLTGPGTVTEGTTQTYYVDADPDPDTQGHTWTVTGGTIQSGQGTTSITVLWGSSSGSPGNVSVVATNFAGSSSATSMSVTIDPTVSVPSKPATPTAPATTLYKPQSGSVSVNVSTTGATGATSYTWAVSPSGASVTGTGTTATFTATAPGTYQVTVAGVNAGGAGPQSDPLPIVVKDTYGATFTITDSDGGAPLQGANVNMTTAVPFSINIDAQTNASGIATFTDMPDGTYNVNITLANYVTITTTATIAGGNITPSYAMTAVANPTYSLTLHVTNQVTSATVQGLSVTCNSTTLTTDADGNVVFTGLDDNTSYNYVITGDYYQTVDQNVTMSGNTTENVAITPLAPTMPSIPSPNSGSANICAGSTDTYSSTAGDNTLNLVWSWGSGTKATPTEPGVITDYGNGTCSITFDPDFVGTAYLQVAGSNPVYGAGDVAVLEITVSGNAVAAFTVDIDQSSRTVSIVNNGSGGTEYTWDYGDMSGSAGVYEAGVNPAPYTYAADGTYTITMTTVNAVCGNATATETVTIINTGFSDVSVDAITVFPNPTTDGVTIRCKEQGSFRVADVSGKTISSGPLTGSDVKVNLPAIGMYFVTLTPKDGTNPLVKKVIKK